MKITVVGIGEFGLLNGAIFSVIGHDVCCIAPDKATCDAVNKGEYPSDDPATVKTIQIAVGMGQLRSESDADLAAFDSDVVMITADDLNVGHSIRDKVLSNAERVCSAIRPDAPILIMANVPVGTHEELEELFFQWTGTRHHVVNMPQTAQYNRAAKNVLCPTRVVIGTENPEVAQIIQKLYQPIAESEQSIPVEVMSPEAAEGAYQTTSRRFKAVPERRSISDHKLMNSILKHFDNNLVGKRIAIWGSDNDETDVRAAVQTLRLAKKLSRFGAHIICHCGIQNISGWNGKIETVTDKADAIQKSDALIVLLPSTQYVGISSDPGMLTWKMNKVVVFDVWGCLDKQSLTYGSAVYYNISEGRAFKDLPAAMKKPTQASLA